MSMGATILTHADVGDRPLADVYPRTAEPARVGAGGWIGANATVLVGCEIGEALSSRRARSSGSRCPTEWWWEACPPNR